MSSLGQASSTPKGEPTSPSGQSSVVRQGEAAAPRYKGVRMRKWGSWVAEVRCPRSRERIWLGSHDTAENAARAYDAAVWCLRGRSATFNFPNDLPTDIPSAGTGNFTREQIREVAAKHAAAPPRGTEPEVRAEEGGDHVGAAGSTDLLGWSEDPLAGFPSPEWTPHYEDDSSQEDSGGDGCCLWSFDYGDGPPFGGS